MDTMGQITAVALTAAVLGALLRRTVPELAMVLALCAGIWIVMEIVGGLSAVAALVRELSELAGVTDELLEPVFKAVALSIMTRLTAELCRSAGEGGMAAFVETAGTVLALVASLPLVQAVTVLMMELLS